MIVLKLISNILKKTLKTAPPTPVVMQQNRALLQQQLKSLDTFVSSQTPLIKTSQAQAIGKIDELAKAIAKTLPKQ